MIGSVTPYSALQVQSFHSPFYDESDLTGRGFGLAYNARTATDTCSELGVRFDRVVPVGAGAVVANGLAMGARFEGEFASESQTYAGFGRVRYAWSPWARPIGSLVSRRRRQQARMAATALFILRSA